MITTVLASIPGRALRFGAGSAIALWGFAFGLPEALFVQTIGISIAVFAIADVCVMDRTASSATPNNGDASVGVQC